MKIALLNDELKKYEHDNAALQTQRDVYKDQLQKFQDIIHLRTSHVPYAKDPDKNNIVMIIEKTTPYEEDKLYQHLCYIVSIQRWFITTKNDGLRHNTHIIGS